jgi:glycosyltransferase involved in cell wall biosynthesis
MTFDIVIPTYTIDAKLEQMAYDCARSYKQYVDKIIICEDGGKFSPKLQAIADSYIYNWENVGFTKNVNRGWRYSNADFTGIVSSDTYLYEGDLRDLCIQGKVTSPEIVNQHVPFLAGPLWVCPKEIYKERGDLVETMHTYCSDSEYDHRVRDIFQKVPEVIIFHHMSQTVTPAGVNTPEESEKDRKEYAKLKVNENH